jgi:hypothetical protein
MEPIRALIKALYCTGVGSHQIISPNFYLPLRFFSVILYYNFHMESDQADWRQNAIFALIS